MKAQWILPAGVILIVLALQAGCTSAGSQAGARPPVSTLEPANPQPTVIIPTQTIPENKTVYPTQEPTPTSAWLKNLIEKAQADLAQRTAVPVMEITLVSAEEVTWPDSSLGCPQPGMAYAQILMPGYRIILDYGGRQFEYHAGRGTEAFYCPNPTPPVPGAPGDT